MTWCRSARRRSSSEMNGRWGVSVEGKGSAEAAVRGADVVITAGPIEDTRRATLQADWLAPGSLTVTLDYDSYVTDEAIAAADLVLTDDRGQIEDARLHEGKFTGVTRIDAELGELISHRQGSPNQRRSAHPGVQPRHCPGRPCDRHRDPEAGAPEGHRHAAAPLNELLGAIRPEASAGKTLLHDRERIEDVRRVERVRCEQVIAAEIGEPASRPAGPWR